MKTEHTEAPWDWDPVHSQVVKRYDVQNDDGTWGMQTLTICEIPTVHKEGNPHLIAAAPELLQTLGEIGDVLDQWATKQEPTLEEIDEMRGVIESAIAKAQGKP